MNRGIGTLIVLGLIGGAVWIGLATGDKRVPEVSVLEPESAATNWPDPDDRELDCPPGDLIQTTTADYPFGAKCFEGEAVDAVKRSLEGLQPEDEIRPNFRDFGAWAQVIRDGSLIGVVELGWTGSGWLVGSSSFCASSRILHG